MKTLPLIVNLCVYGLFPAKCLRYSFSTVCGLFKCDIVWARPTLRFSSKFVNYLVAWRMRCWWSVNLSTSREHPEWTYCWTISFNLRLVLFWLILDISLEVRGDGSVVYFIGNPIKVYLQTLLEPEYKCHNYEYLHIQIFALLHNHPTSPLAEACKYWIGSLLWKI